MFSFAILIGIYSYLIFTLGILGLIDGKYILSLTLVFISIFAILIRKFKIKNLINVDNFLKDKLVIFLVALLILQSLINLIGVFGPELGFDALWYHLTLPKLYIQNHIVLHIPGSLLYYSDMPKLTETLYTSALLFGNEILAKFAHFLFGIFSLFAIYFLARKFFNVRLSILTVVIFYSNLVVGWESITAYIDLARTFFEVMALWGFINFLEDKNKKWLIESAVMLGLAISTKLLALGSIFIFLCLIVYFGISNHNKITKVFKNVSIYIFFSLLVPLPWFVFSFIHNGNPFYPMFSNIVSLNYNISILNPMKFISDVLKLLIYSPDPLSPLYLILLPLVLLTFNKFKGSIKFILLYSLLAIVIWYFTPRVGGGRFILPYLPAFSILIVQVIKIFEKKKYFSRLFLFLIITISLSSIIYRGVANAKFLPVILGRESRDEFLSKNLNFSFGDFYDTDGYFKKNINSKDTVLLYGFHNLYYVNFPFIDSSWVKKGDMFNYIATQNSDLPKKFSNWNLIYYNSKTHVNLYSLGGTRWVY